MRSFLLLLVVVILAGCQRYKYEIDLKPAGADMERSLTISRSNTSGKGAASAIDADELRRIANLYKADVKDTAVSTASFASKFQRTMPQDVGGAGTHAAFETSLGAFHIYSEQFRAQDDLLAQWERQAAAVDLFVDLTIGWTDENLKGETGLDKLHAFLDNDFRRDMKNAVLYVRWSGISLHEPTNANEESGKARATELIAMMAQYFHARGYFEVDDLPLLYTAGMSGDSQVWALPLARRQILKRMGRDPAGPLPASLAAIADQDKLRESTEGYTKSNPVALERIKRWAATRPPIQDGKDPLGEAMSDLIDLKLFGDADQLELRLHPKHKPFATNGQWQAADSTVTWSRSLNTSVEESTGLPVTAVALWSDPNAAEQDRLLGSTCLHDGVLASYCLERLALNKAQGEEWDSFLQSLAPEEGLADRLRAFRFKGRESDKDPPAVSEILASNLRHGE